MLLAAGKGARLKPLTDTVPKPLVTVGGESLIERHIRKLCSAGFNEIIINISYLGDKIVQSLGDGSRYGVHILWSDEHRKLLGTGGGIHHARHLLGDEPWLVINADIYTDWQPSMPEMPDGALAHLILVDNPPHHPTGDYSLHGDKIGFGDKRLTFAGIGCYRKELFANGGEEIFQLPQVLVPAIERGLVRGTHYRGVWADIGTPDRLDALKRQYGE